MHATRPNHRPYQDQNFPDDLRRLAKIEAAKANMPLNQWIYQALREKLEREAKKEVGK